MEFLVPALAGALAGGAVSAYLTNREHKRQKQNVLQGWRFHLVVLHARLKYCVKSLEAHAEGSVGATFATLAFIPSYRDRFRVLENDLHLLPIDVSAPIVDILGPLDSLVVIYEYVRPDPKARTRPAETLELLRVLVDRTSRAVEKLRKRGRSSLVANAAVIREMVQNSLDDLRK